MDTKQAIRQFLDNNTILRTKSSVASYEQHLSLLSEVVPATVTDVTIDDLVRFIQAPSKRGGFVSPGYQFSRRKVACAWMRWCNSAGVHDLDPDVLIERCPIKVTATRQHTWLTASQAARVLAEADVWANPHRVARDRLAFALALYTGARLNALTSMTWASLAFSEGLVELAGKGSPPYKVGLTAALEAELLRYVDGLDVRPMATDPVIPAIQWDVQTRTHRLEPKKALGPSGWRALIANAGAHVGAPSLRPHDVRRSMAGILDARDVPIATIQQFLNHSSPATTVRYLAPNPAKAIATMKEFTL